MEITMPPFADYYVLVQARSIEHIESFLNHFLPEREIIIDNWIVPFGTPADSGTAIEIVDDLITYCLENPNEYQSISWRSTKNIPPRLAEVYFTDDREMIFGLSSFQGEDEDNWLQKLEDFFGTDIGYIAYEKPPPTSGKEFRKICTSLKTGTR
ncbi:MAG: hypothetical protein GY832_02345 [Chloroflexi bacterium]|nr:hypothetical protein [Chloroflexota bacterium]